MNKDDLVDAYFAFAKNFKGSEDLHGIAQDRFKYHHIQLGDLSNPAYHEGI